MKKLLGGMFARSPSAESPRAASTPTGVSDTFTSAPKRWGAFLLPSAPPPPTADQATLKHLDAAMRGVAAHVKAVIARIVDGEEHREELLEFAQFVEKLQEQSCEPSLEVLRSYFSWPEGIAFCEQTGFPSLVLDFVSKMRAFAVMEELQGMLGAGGERNHISEHLTGREDAALQAEAALGFAKLVPSLDLLMNCVLAIGSNETLMDTFRCELPNLLALTAEEYPPMALFIRDFCGRALTSVSERNFNAGLAWYLLDCNTIPKSIQLMTNYALATNVTPETAARALERYQDTARKRLKC
ncbi:uncharacterized protein KRP23_10922 [Phytophthora ramorum]|uniref:uncharacterized protein n=1 Tax=Phytophthora ramorum TaxID=164328 RepID=UPI0030AAC0BF|nr:hypothetical protein KRP23_10922 [Phytophthora ramorum]